MQLVTAPNDNVPYHPCVTKSEQKVPLAANKTYVTKLIYVVSQTLWFRRLQSSLPGLYEFTQCGN